jgi:hypothetical protein
MSVGNPVAAPANGTRRPETLFVLSIRCVSCPNCNFSYQNRRAYGEAHLRDGNASKIGRGVKSLIARSAQLIQDRVLLQDRFRPYDPAGLVMESSGCACSRVIAASAPHSLIQFSPFLCVLLLYALQSLSTVRASPPVCHN